MKKLIKYFSYILMLSFICISLIGCKTTEEMNDNYNLKIIDVVDNGIGLKMTKLASDNSSTDTVKVSATVLPSNATNKELIWELAWKTTKADNIGIYLSKTISSDTSYCTFEYLRPFDTQIILTVTSVRNPKVSATCTFDCYKKNIITCDIYADLVDCDGTLSSAYPSSEFDFRDLSTIAKDQLNDCCFDFSMCDFSTTSVGTIESDISQINDADYVFYLSDDLKDTLTSYGIKCKDDYGIVFDSDFNYSFEEMLGEFTEVDSFTNDFYLALFEIPTWFELRVCDNDDVFASFDLLFSFEPVEI